MPNTPFSAPVAEHPGYQSNQAPESSIQQQHEAITSLGSVEPTSTQTVLQTNGNETVDTISPAGETKTVIDERDGTGPDTPVPEADKATQEANNQEAKAIRSFTQGEEVK